MISGGGGEIGYQKATFFILLDNSLIFRGNKRLSKGEVKEKSFFQKQDIFLINEF